MGHDTVFDGAVTIRPRLPDAFVGSFNVVASKRNNVFGDGDEGSFDHLLFGNRGTGAGPAIDGKYDNPAWTGVPSTWNQLRLNNGHKKKYTTLECRGRSGFYNYVQWLQFVVDYIIRENQEEKALDFQGSITWNWDRKHSDDRGTLTVKRIRGRWKVLVYLETPCDVHRPASAKAHQFRSMYTTFVRGGYLSVLLPGPNKEALVELMDEAVLKDDPYNQPECMPTDTAVIVYVKPRGLRSLLELCLSAAATNLAKINPAQAQQLLSRLPEELQVELKGGRHCSGCGCLFTGPAAVNVSVWVPIGATGQPILGRYCSVRCWRDEETDARKRIDVEPEPFDEDD